MLRKRGIVFRALFEDGFRRNSFESRLNRIRNSYSL